MLLAAGVLGYFFNKMKFQLAPLVVGLILGPNIEKHFREALFLSQGDPWIYVESPIAVAVWLLVVVNPVPSRATELVNVLLIGHELDERAVGEVQDASLFLVGFFP